MRSALLQRGRRMPSGQRICIRKFLHAVSSWNSLSNASIVCMHIIKVIAMTVNSRLILEPFASSLKVCEPV